MSEATREVGDQIREVLAALATLQVEGNIYLKLSDVLDATENILYPDGLQTESQYNRLMAISKAGCKAIGYSDSEVTLLPPAVSFGERGTYLRKMPEITDEVIEGLISQLLMQGSEFISSPYIAIKREKLAPTLAHKHYQLPWSGFDESEQEHLRQRGDEVAKKLGYRVRTFDDTPWLAGKELYVKAMTPDLGAWRETVSQEINLRAYPKASQVIAAGLRAAFDGRVDRDPLMLISHDQWVRLFDELGFIYDKEQSKLTPKPINLPKNIVQALERAISNLPTYKHSQIGNFLIKDDLLQTAKGVLGPNVTDGQLRRFVTDGIIGRVLIKLGYDLTTRWISQYELTMLPEKTNKGAEVFALAMKVDREIKYPAFAKGFRIHSPVLVRDSTDLVYMELLGPRQAVKANWASLRGHNRLCRPTEKYHFFAGYRLEVPPESKPTTLKTTLPCGWDHWCLIHRQASYEKLTPNDTFYLVDHAPSTDGPPSTFIAFLAKSLAIPILPQWAEHLWVEGRMKKLITPLSQNCYGYGGWKVEVHSWGTIVSEGLAEKKISF